jgi:tRNA(Ile)-lysidine synthase
VRHELLPRLKERNPQVERSIARTIDVLECEDAYLEGLVDDALGARGNAALTLPAALLDLPQALARRVVRRACREAIAAYAPEARIDFEHIEDIIARGANPGFALHLPGGIEVRNKRGTLYFSKAKPPRQA